MTMTADQAAALREPFKPEQIGKLPKPTKKENPKGRCNECGGWHGLPAVHLDYVGHAAITDRLLQVDPAWSWEPMAVDEHGFPLLDRQGGLWIKLTVCGVTRPGYGDETNGKGMKEVIGDALRNGAMRFGVGLDLWSKEVLHVDENGNPEGSGGGSNGGAAAPAAVRRETPESAAASSTTSFTPPDGATSQEAQDVRNREAAGRVRKLFGAEKYKDKTIAEIADMEGGVGHLEWIASDKFEPKQDAQKHFKQAAQAWLGMEPLPVGGGTDDDIPFDRTVA